MADASEPAKQHPGERLANFFDNFFKTIVGVCTFGASITFAKVVQTPVEPWVNYGFSKVTVQYYLANSWLFFVLDLVITSFAACALSLWRPQAVSYFGTNDSNERRVVMWYATLVSMVLFGLLITAFVFLGLVITAYAGPTGWAAIGFTIFFGTTGFASIVWQSPIGSSPPETEKERYERRRRHQERLNGSRYDDKMEGFTDDVLEGEEIMFGDETGMRSYTDEGNNKESPISRPIIAAVPTYTEDLRRVRAIKASDGSRYSWREV